MHRGLAALRYGRVPPGAAVVIPGGLCIGRKLCWQCSLRGTTPPWLVDELPCGLCSGARRLFHRGSQNCSWNKHGMNSARAQAHCLSGCPGVRYSGQLGTPHQRRCMCIEHHYPDIRYAYNCNLLVGHFRVSGLTLVIRLRTFLIDRW